MQSATMPGSRWSWKSHRAGCANQPLRAWSQANSRDTPNQDRSAGVTSLAVVSLAPVVFLAPWGGLYTEKCRGPNYWDNGRRILKQRSCCEEFLRSGSLCQIFEACQLLARDRSL